MLGGNAHTLCNSLDADFVRSGYEDVKTWTVTENVICATADEDGRALVRDGAYDIALDDEQLVVTHVVVCRTEASNIHDETGQCEEIPLLVTLGEKFPAEAALLRCLGNEFLVIDRDAEFLAQSQGNQFSATSELASDIDYQFLVFHNQAFLNFILLPKISGSSPSLSVRNLRKSAASNMAAIMMDNVSAIGKLIHTPLCPKNTGRK